MALQLCLLFWIFGAQIPRPAGPPSPAAAARATIAGTVVFAGTNVPVPRAQVRIRENGAVRGTDAAGNFSFIVAPGRYTLIVDRAGMMLQEDARNALTPAGKLLTISADQKLVNVILPLISAPTISGYTYNPYGEPLAGAAMHAYRWRFTPQGPRLRIVRTALTNDLGEFRFFGIEFGDYVVSASYSRRAQRAALAGTRLSANVTDPDDGYTTVFYGGGTTPLQAGTVRVAPGVDSGTLNVVFREIPRLKVRGRVVSAGSLPSDLKIVFVPEGSDVVLDSGSLSVSVGSGGDFEIRGVSPGSYVILAYGSGQSSDVMQINVTNEDVEKLAVPLVPTSQVTGRVLSDSRTDLQGMKVSLVRTDSEIEQRFDGFIAPGGTFTVTDIGPGEYDVFIDRLFAGSYIRTIRLGGRDVLANGLRPGFDPIDENTRLEIALSSVAATVNGRVIDRAGVPSVGTRVVLVPESRYQRRTDRYIVGVTDASGGFELSRVPPGRYTAYAFEQIEPGAYYAFAYNSQLVQRFADRAASINVNEVKSTTVELRVIPYSETAAGFR